MTTAPTSAPTPNVPVAGPAGARWGAPGAGQGRTIAGSVPGARSVVSRLFHGTPGRMRLYAVLGVVAAVVLGAVCANALLSSQSAVERAANNTAQVVRAQSIHVDLLRADAIATNAFLVGGLESPASRARYEAAMGRVATGIAEAAAAQPADGAALGALSEQVQTYAVLVEQGRTNNRLGLPVGAQYLTQASAGLRADAIPIVAAVVSANEARADDEFGRSTAVLQLAIGLLALIGLVAIAVWLAKRTHRYLNVSLTAAVAILLVALVFTLLQVIGIGSAARAVADGAFTQTVALADATTAANDARANESLTLIRRGSGQSNEKAWRADDAAVRKALGSTHPTLLATWGRYADVHTTVRRLDDNGRWDDAVARSTASTAQGSDGTFTRFDSDVTAARDDAGKKAVAQLSGLGGAAPFAAVAVAIAALLAAWLVVRGIGQRIEEYR
jgi:hypothetical protein